MATFDFGKNIANAYFNAQRIRQAKEQFQQKLTDQRNQWMAQNAIARDRLAAIRAQTKQAQTNADRLFKQQALYHKQDRQDRYVTQAEFDNYVASLGGDASKILKYRKNMLWSRLAADGNAILAKRNSAFRNTLTGLQAQLLKYKTDDLQKKKNTNNQLNNLLNSPVPKAPSINHFRQSVINTGSQLLQNGTSNPVTYVEDLINANNHATQQGNRAAYFDAVRRANEALKLTELSHGSNTPQYDNPKFQERAQSLGLFGINPGFMTGKGINGLVLPDKLIQAVDNIKRHILIHQLQPTGK